MLHCLCGRRRERRTASVRYRAQIVARRQRQGQGRQGDGQTEDTAAIQAAIDEVGGTEGTVLVLKGTYMVDAVDKKQRLSLRGDMRFEVNRQTRKKNK